MRVQSSAVNMMSMRQFTRKSTVASRQASYGIGLTGGGMFSVSGQGKQQSGQSSVRFGSQLMQKYESAQNVNAVSAREQFKSLQQIQFESLNYLLRMFMRLPLNQMSNSPLSGSGMNTIYQVNEQYASIEESETTAFSTTGKVVTQDGREIDFDLSLTMSRRFEASAYSASISMPEYCDPLVINLDSNISEVSSQKFMFDIDADGILDSVSMPTSGSGFLALDKNGDGIINDGSELFGTSSGDGFKDLAAYDSDGNGWIDEGDEIWNKLLIWTKDSDGNDKLCGLAEAGVGAIYLGNVSTNFSLNDQHTNEANAAIRKTGIFLYENGGVGTVQHVDFAKQSGREFTG